MDPAVTVSAAEETASKRKRLSETAALNRCMAKAPSAEYNAAGARCVAACDVGLWVSIAEHERIKAYFRDLET
jgi:hypothetical protein